MQPVVNSTFIRNEFWKSKFNLLVVQIQPFGCSNSTFLHVPKTCLLWILKRLKLEKFQPFFDLERLCLEIQPFGKAPKDEMVLWVYVPYMCVYGWDMAGLGDDDHRHARTQ